VASARRKRPGRASPRAGGAGGARRVPRAVLTLAASPRRPAAERAAKLLVRLRVLACATVAPGGRAFYTWRGREEAHGSTLLYGKTTAARAQDAVRLIRETHPDRVAEILVLEIAGGNPEYLAWVAEAVGAK